jgi:hypothetical protein
MVIPVAIHPFLAAARDGLSPAEVQLLEAMLAELPLLIGDYDSHVQTRDAN